MNTEPAQSLRQLLDGSDPIFMPGCYDAFSAKMIQETGFKAAAISGFAIEAAHLGGPDIGLMTLTELTDQARRITDVVDIPVIADVDTGFGGIQNIVRTVRQAEKAGLAGLHLEDQSMPKKCPLLPGRRVVSLEEARNRYAAALETRTSDEFVVIARTDSDVLSYDEQIARSNAYLETGVDCVLPMLIDLDGKSFASLHAAAQMEHIARVCEDIAGPVMFVGPPPPGYTANDVAQAGIKIVSHSAVTLNAAATAMKYILTELLKTGDTVDFFTRNPDHLQAGLPMLEMLNVNYYLDLEQRFDAN